MYPLEWTTATLLISCSFGGELVAAMATAQQTAAAAAAFGAIPSKRAELPTRPEACDKTSLPADLTDGPDSAFNRRSILPAETSLREKEEEK